MNVTLYIGWNMSLDLDDEEAFLSGLSARMEEQKAKGIEIGKDNIDEASHFGLTIKRKPFVELPPQTVVYDKPQLTKILCVGDLETDPFSHGRIPEPFCAGLYIDDPEDPTGEGYHQFWGDDCVEQMFSFLVELMERTGKDYVVYFHNGGKFDFKWFTKYLDDSSAPFFIDTRMVKAMFCGIEFRDSYSLIPVALRKLVNKNSAKTDIEYWKMERMYREQYKEEILEYLRMDCVTLIDALRDFISRFGWRLTIAGTATPYINNFHGFDCMDYEADTLIRPFFGGGRVQPFEYGIIIAPEGEEFVMVDNNSMYPAAMKNFMHPVSVIPKKYKDLRDDTDFAIIHTDYNEGCLGYKDGIDYSFTRKTGRFLATIHEIRAGLSTGTLSIKKVEQSFSFTHKVSFADFVDHFYSLRLDAKANNDISGTEFYKLVMNSGYGRFAMNTTGYKEYLVNPSELPLPQWSKTVERDENKKIIKSPNGWRIARKDDTLTVWQRPARNAGTKFVNVATAASITGAARSVLWNAICSSDRPLYCDTDSIICRRFHGDLDDKRLGAWKVEATGNAVFIAGKKMYAFLTTTRPKDADRKAYEELSIEGKTFYLLKKAHKGVQLTGSQIMDICKGNVIEYTSEVPTFKIDGSVTFSSRKVQMTRNGAQVTELGQMELPL